MSVLRFFRRGSRGFTFVELVVATAVMMILASAALPIARVSMKRQREKDLRYTLREMRTAIDKFKDYADTQRIAAYELQFGSENYPASLDVLVEGVAVANDTTGRKLKFLRRIPIDPMTGRAEWGMRSLPGQSRFQGLGRPERLRRLLEVGRDRARRDEVSRLVTTMDIDRKRPRISSSEEQRKNDTRGQSRLDDHRAADRHLDHHDPGGAGADAVPELDSLRARKPR